MLVRRRPILGTAGDISVAECHLAWHLVLAGYAQLEALMHEAVYVRLFSDDHGESHFEEVEVALQPVDFAPPAPPLHVAALFPTLHCSFVSGPPDWGGHVPHPSPRRQLLCNLRGEYDVTASDDTVRHFSPGNVLLLEDTTGKGHTTRIVSDDDMLLVAVALAG